MEGLFASVYRVLHLHLPSTTKYRLRLVSRQLRYAVDENVDKLVVGAYQLHRLGVSRCQPHHLTICLRGMPLSWAGLQLASVLRNLKTLVLTEGWLGHELGQAFEGSLQKITRLELHGVEVAEPERLWPNLTGVRHITLYDMPLSSEVINHLLSFPELKSLALAHMPLPGYDTPASDSVAQIQDLVRLTQLEALELQGPGVVTGDLGSLTALGRLAHFVWRDGPVERNGAWQAILECLASWPGLVHLHLDTKITSPLLRGILKNLPYLCHLGCKDMSLALAPGEPKVVMPDVRTLHIRRHYFALDTLAALEAPQLERLEGDNDTTLYIHPGQEQCLQQLAGGLLCFRSSIHIRPSLRPAPHALLVPDVDHHKLPAAQVQAIFTALSSWRPKSALKQPTTLEISDCYVSKAVMAALPPTVSVLTFKCRNNITPDALQPLGSKASLTSLDLRHAAYNEYDTSLKSQVIFLAQTAAQGDLLQIIVPPAMFTAPELENVKHMVTQLRQQAGVPGGMPALVPAHLFWG